MFTVLFSNRSSRADIIAFNDTLDGSSPKTPFVNSATVTHSDFANYLHRDRDHIASAFGIWWPAKCIWDAEKKMYRYVFAEDAKQSSVKGGAFLWGEFGLAVDFAQ